MFLCVHKDQRLLCAYTKCVKLLPLAFGFVTLLSHRIVFVGFVVNEYHINLVCVHLLFIDSFREEKRKKRSSHRNVPDQHGNLNAIQRIHQLDCSWKCSRNVLNAQKLVNSFVHRSCDLSTLFFVHSLYFFKFNVSLTVLILRTHTFNRTQETSTSQYEILIHI